MKEISEYYRMVQLDRILSKPNEMDIFFYSIWNDLSIVNCNVYNTDGGEFIYYNSDIYPIFYQDLENQVFWCDSDKFWLLFESRFSMEYKDIQLFVWNMVSEALKKEIEIPQKPLPLSNSSHEVGITTTISETLKSEISEPIKVTWQPTPTVSDALKKELAKPTFRNYKSFNKVSEVLKEIDHSMLGESTISDALIDSLCFGDVSIPTRKLFYCEQPISDALKNESIPTPFLQSHHPGILSALKVSFNDFESTTPVKVKWMGSKESTISEVLKINTSNAK